MVFETAKLDVVGGPGRPLALGTRFARKRHVRIWSEGQHTGRVLTNLVTLFELSGYAKYSAYNLLAKIPYLVVRPCPLTPESCHCQCPSVTSHSVRKGPGEVSDMTKKGVHHTATMMFCLRLASNISSWYALAVKAAGLDT